MKKNSPSPLKSLRLAIIVLLALIIYAYGFQVTQVNFSEIRSPQRQESLTRVLRALARPDLMRYAQDELVVGTSIQTPCLVGQEAPAQPGGSEPYLVITPHCTEPNTDVTVEGFNLPPNASGPIQFIPSSAVTLRRGVGTSDSEGYLNATIRLPDRPDPAAQRIQVTLRQNVGTPQWTQTARDTWSKIIETVFLALLATTFGVFLAVPISFFAARNIMRDVNSTLSALALTILAWPLGIWIGGTVAGWLTGLSLRMSGNVPLMLAVLAVSLIIAGLGFRWALPQEEITIPSPRLRLARFVVTLVAALFSLMVILMVSRLLIQFGAEVAPALGSFGFLGLFLSSVGEIFAIVLVVASALGAGAVLSSFAGRLGKRIYLGLPVAARLWVNMALGGLAGAVLFMLVGAGIAWLYQITNRTNTMLIPGLVGATLGILVALRTRKLDILPVGLTVYFVTRTILNALRAIEALIMAIVFVIWVGIGPFAGVLALSLHTVAALAKLYSEQVESIMAGPIEAVKATGATRLQTIIYGVVPQIVPPYISFTMYRWDINVRMSTIIGFAGGGGIGFLLAQNINLLNYRAASAQMLAIAIVVGLMDYLSSYMREKVV